MGWLFIVRAQTEGDPDTDHEGEGRAEKALELARWEAGLGSTAWVDGLVNDGRAAKLAAGGYPNKYAALAKDVLPLLKDGPPLHAGPPVVGDDYYTPGGWTGKAQFNAERINACSPSVMLTVETWDLS